MRSKHTSPNIVSQVARIFLEKIRKKKKKKKKRTEWDVSCTRREMVLVGLHVYVINASVVLLAATRSHLFSHRESDCIFERYFEHIINR